MTPVMKAFTPSQLREDVYRILDKAVETGQPVLIKRKGTFLKIVPPQRKSRLMLLKKRKVIKGDPEKLVHLNWEKEWKKRSI